MRGTSILISNVKNPKVRIPISQNHYDLTLRKYETLKEFKERAKVSVPGLTSLKIID